MELFHASGLLYEAGDDIQPGNWGRVILGAGAQAQNFFFREHLFEEVRLRVAPNKPSRLRSLFGMRTREDVERYAQENGLRHCYLVEVIKPATSHSADLGLFDRLNAPNHPDSVRRVIEQYWSGAAGPFMEVFVEAPGRVLERLTMPWDLPAT